MTSASASSRWLIDTMSPRFIHAVMTSVTGTSIIVARSLTVTNSVTLRTLCSFCSRSISSFIRAETASRLSLRYLAPFILLPLAVRRARVSFICFCTSSSFTSGRAMGLGDGLPFFLSLRAPAFWAAAPAEAGLDGCGLLMSTRSLVMRLRFSRLCPPPLSVDPSVETSILPSTLGPDRRLLSCVGRNMSLRLSAMRSS